MEIRYALIKAGVVENVIVAGADFIVTISHQYDHCELLDTPDEQKVTSIGWRWDGVTFVSPEVPSPLITPVSQPRYISVGAFFDLFGPAKWAILADENPRETLHKSPACVLGVSPAGENWRHETSSSELQSLPQENP